MLLFHYAHIPVYTSLSCADIVHQYIIVVDETEQSLNGSQKMNIIIWSYNTPCAQNAGSSNITTINEIQIG
ncbi:hypothetical protein LINPERPRIM_LOCUS16936 [Linum perenne]